MNDHCAMYKTLTIEEKLLIDADMKKWFAESIDLCLPMSIYKVIEIDFIERLKRKEKNDKRNRESGASRTDSK